MSTKTQKIIADGVKQRYKVTAFDITENTLVFIDGSLQPEGFKKDFGGNTIYFEFVPSEGSTILISGD